MNSNTGNTLPKEGIIQQVKSRIAKFTEWDGSILNTIIAKAFGHKYYLPFYQRRFPPNGNPIQVSAYIFRSKQDLLRYKKELDANPTFRFVCYSAFRSPLKIQMSDGAFGDKVLVSLFAGIIRKYRVNEPGTQADEKPH